MLRNRIFYSLTVVISSAVEKSELNYS